MAEETKKAAGKQTDEPSSTSPMDAYDTTEPESHAGAPARAGTVLPPAPSHKRGWWQRLGDRIGRHRKSVGLVVLVVALAALGGVPWTRYKLAGLALKQSVQVTVLDTQTHQAVPSANVTLAGKHITTDNHGMARLRVRVGTASLAISKNYYRSHSSHVLVPILRQKQPFTVSLQATGRQVSVSVTNKISGQPVANATIAAAGTQTKTDNAGRAVIVLPADHATVAATVTASGYNSTSSTIQVASQAGKPNTVALTPAGTVYFLSNAAGTLDVVKTNLDGTNRHVVLAGTGNEQPHDTSLLASRDWKYLALKAVRDPGGTAKLYVINAATDKVTAFDEGQADFTLVGWYNHAFLYGVARTNTQLWEPGRQALKSYNAETGQLSQLDQTQAEGDQTSGAFQTLGNYYILPGQLFYTVGWEYIGNTAHLAGKTASLRTVSLTNQTKKDVKTFDAQTTSIISARASEPTSVYVVVYNNSGQPSYYEYEDGAVKTASLTADSFTQAYPTYLLSPGSASTFWSELRDGKNTLFVGDKAGKNAKQIASLSDYQPYGWFSDQYVLVSKGGSELYIMPVSGGTALKIADYYKPAAPLYGYGYGYGGL